MESKGIYASGVDNSILFWHSGTLHFHGWSGRTLLNLNEHQSSRRGVRILGAAEYKLLGNLDKLGQVG